MANTAAADAAGPEVVMVYVQEAVAGAAMLLQEFPIVGTACKIFLSFEQAIETAKSNKDELANLHDVIDLVVKGVFRHWEQKPDCDLNEGIQKLLKHIKKAEEIAKGCRRRSTVKQFILSRRISREIAAVKENVLAMCMTNTLLITVSIREDLDSMGQTWVDTRFDSMEEEEQEQIEASETESQELRKTPRVKVPGSPCIREWYVEREAVVSKACEGLGVGSSGNPCQEPRMVGLAGPGGAGKSTVASMVVARADVQLSFRKGVLWLPVGKGAKDRLSALMFDLAEMVYETVMLNTCRPPRKAKVLLNTEDGAAYIREVVENETSRRFLVVADDVWDVEVLEELRKAGAWVLYTTRQEIRMPGAPLLRLDEVRREEAELVLRRAAELDDDEPLPEAAYEVMGRCGRVVLDLVLVGRRGEVRGRSDERAWRKVLGRVLEAQEDGEGAQRQRRPWRAAALRAGLGVLAADNPLNKELYLALALLPTGLAFPSKVAGVLLFGDDLSAEALRAAGKVLEVLERLSILALEASDKYRVHEDHVDFVRDCCLSTSQETRETALPRWRKYVSSAEALDTYTSGWLAKMWDVLAQVEGGAVAPSPYDGALEALGPSSPEFPETVRKVAEFHVQRKDWQQAYNKYGQLLEVGAGGLPVAKVLHKLGMCASEMPGYEEETVSLLRQALKIQEQTLGDDHPYVANTLHSLGVCIREAGETGEAEKLLRQALAIRKEKLSGDPLSLARIQYSLGVCVYNTGRLQEAEEELLQEALAIRVGRLGHDHQEVANVLYYLGLCAHKAGRTEEGERKLHRALEIFEQKLGRDHLDVADTLFALGICALEAGGRAGEAETFYRRSLAIRQQRLRAQHWKVESTIHVLGVCASMAVRMEEERVLLGVAFGYEVAVCGGINVIEKDTQQDDHPGSKVLKVSGFMRATTNFMLSKAQREGADYRDVLAEARNLGHAEADLRHLLAELMFGATVSSESIQCKGAFLSLSAVDVEYATMMQSTIKLLGTATLSPANDKLSVVVSPVVVPLSHPVASSEGPEGIISAGSQEWEPATVDAAGFYMRITCQDQVGIVERVGSLAAKNNVSIHAILQNPIKDAANVDFVVTTSPCKHSQVKNLSASIANEEWAKGVPLVMLLL